MDNTPLRVGSGNPARLVHTLVLLVILSTKLRSTRPQRNRLQTASMKINTEMADNRCKVVQLPISTLLLLKGVSICTPSTHAGTSLGPVGTPVAEAPLHKLADADVIKSASALSCSSSAVSASLCRDQAN